MLLKEKLIDKVNYLNKMEKGKMTVGDIDILTSAMFVFIHSAEKLVNELYKYYADQIMEMEDTKRLINRMGYARAQQEAKRIGRELVDSAKCNAIRDWKRAADEMVRASQQCTVVGLQSGLEGVKTGTLFDALLQDSQYMIRLFLLNGNIHPDDYIRVESTLKALADKNNHPIDDSLADKFRPNI